MSWKSAVVASDVVGGWVVVQSPEGFLVDANGALFSRQWMARQDLPVLAEQGLGYLEQMPVFLLQVRSCAALEGATWQGLRSFLLQADMQTYRLLAYASQISTWLNDHRFCGRCGQATVQVPGERAMNCADCSIQHYPRISPSMIVLVTRGDEILLARSPRFVSGIYSTLAGFLEPGESAEQCVVREVREEVALEISNIRYVGSQCWPFPHSLMLGFHADYVSGEIIRQVDEIEDAQWFRVDALPPLPAQRSIARHLIELYVAQRLGLPEPVLEA